MATKRKRKPPSAATIEGRKQKSEEGKKKRPEIENCVKKSGSQKARTGEKRGLEGRGKLEGLGKGLRKKLSLVKTHKGPNETTTNAERV